MDDVKKEQLKAIIISSIATVLGVLFLVLKAEMIGMLQTVVCFGLLIYGIIQIMIYCFLNTENKDYAKLIFGTIATVVAVLLIFVGILFVILLGLIVAISGVMFIKSAIDDKKEGDKQWWISLIVGTLFLILGVAVAILYNIEVLKNIIMIIFGATLIFEGIMGFVFVLILHKVIRLNFGRGDKEEIVSEEAQDIEISSEEKVEKIEKEKVQKPTKNTQKIEEKSSKNKENVQKTQKTYRVVEEEINPDEGGFV